MKLWIDDVRPAPEGYEWIPSVNMTINHIQLIEHYLERWKGFKDPVKHFVLEECRDNLLKIVDEMIKENTIELIDIDHDAGDYAFDGGDYIKLLDWLEKTGRNYPIRIHSMNPVGVANMRRIIERNGWMEVK